MRLLDEYDVDLAGKRADVVGRSAFLGRPAGTLLLGRDATVTYCHSRTGRPLVDRAGGARPAGRGRQAALHRRCGHQAGCRGDRRRLQRGDVGDVDFETAAERARLITPVPGGVGPMTIAVPLEQTVAAAARQLGVVTRSPASGYANARRPPGQPEGSGRSRRRLAPALRAGSSP